MPTIQQHARHQRTSRAMNPATSSAVGAATPLGHTVAVVAVASTAVLTLGLLTAGSLTHHAGLLTWAMVCGMISLDLVVLAVVKRMMDDAVQRCAEIVAVDMEDVVNRTATQVGVAIAAALQAEAAAEDPSRAPAEGTVRLYS